MLGHKTSVNFFFNIEIFFVSNVVTDYNEMKFEIHNRGKLKKPQIYRY